MTKDSEAHLQTASRFYWQSTLVGCLVVLPVIVGAALSAPLPIFVSYLCVVILVSGVVSIRKRLKSSARTGAR